jgi:phage terminase small subunit|tara:strand:- start:282 stop:800 length:519 start_codon:yes stop_codon:yes gene_type:complete
MGLPKKLTSMQIKFANLVVTEEGRMSATDCAIAAGYSEDTAHVIASRLQNPKHFPLVVEYIGKRRSELLKKYDISYEGHLTELGKLRDEFRQNKAWTAAGNMEVSRGKAAGFYNNQQIHLHKHENLSQEEIDAKVVEALKHYQPIIDKDAEVVTDELSSLPNAEESSSDLQK